MTKDYHTGNRAFVLEYKCNSGGKLGKYQKKKIVLCEKKKKKENFKYKKWLHNTLNIQFARIFKT